MIDHHFRNAHALLTGDSRNEPPSGMREAGREGSRLAEVAAEPDDSPSCVRRLDAGQHLEAVIRAPIVHDDHFVRSTPWLEAAGDLAMQVDEIGRLVHYGDDDAQLDHVAVSISLQSALTTGLLPQQIPCEGGGAHDSEPQRDATAVLVQEGHRLVTVLDREQRLGEVA